MCACVGCIRGYEHPAGKQVLGAARGNPLGDSWTGVGEPGRAVFWHRWERETFGADVSVSCEMLAIFERGKL